MRGTSIFSLPGQLIGAALGTTKEVRTQRNKSLGWRLYYQFYMWRMDYEIQGTMKDYKAGKCRVLKKEHAESFEAFKELMR